MSSVINDSSVFDSKPLDKKNEKQKNQRDLKYFQITKRQKLQHAIQQCLSSYLLTSFKKKISHDFQNKEQMTSKKANERQMWKDSNELKYACANIINNKKYAIKQLSHHLQASIGSFASQIFNAFNYEDSEKLGKQNSFQKNSRTQSKHQLSQSNKNFLVQLFVDTGLLKDYKQTDRSFIRLVNEAQKSYFLRKNQTQQTCQSLRNNKSENNEEYFLKDIKQKSQGVEYLSTLYSTKKRWLNILKSQNYEMEKSLESDQKVIGYSPKQSNYSICEDTKETLNQNQKLKKSSSLQSQLYFLDPVEENCQQIQANQYQYLGHHGGLFALINKKYGDKG